MDQSDSIACLRDTSLDDSNVILTSADQCNNQLYILLPPCILSLHNPLINAFRNATMDIDEFYKA